MFQLPAIVDTGVPGGVATGTMLEFGTGKESEPEVDLAFPEELILLLCRENLAGGCTGGKGQAPGRVELTMRDEALEQVAVGIEDIDEPIAWTCLVVMLVW